MSLVAALLLISWLGAVPAETSAVVVQAPDSPIRLDHAKVLSAAEGPPVLLYAATNSTDDSLDEFTVMVFVFRQGTLKARQVAPGRRTLDARGTKYSAMVLDGFAIEPADVVVVGVNQAQRAGSDQWWRADLQRAAEDAVKRVKP